jgi:hypothetical protein
MTITVQKDAFTPYRVKRAGKVSGKRKLFFGNMAAGVHVVHPEGSFMSSRGIVQAHTGDKGHAGRGGLGHEEKS